MTDVIEKGIPLPAQRKPLAGNFPFADMGPGDSFALNGELPQTVGYLGIETFACEECRGNDEDDYAMNDYELWLEAGQP